MSTYFDRVRAATGMRFWVNNPTAAETERALAAGAMGCTTNPGYGGNLVRRAPDEVLPIIRAAVAEHSDDHAAADRVQQLLVSRIAASFAERWEATGGHEGFVSIQGDPEADTDVDAIHAEALAGRAIGPNVTPKLPATAPGLEAMERLAADGSPLIVTEVFSLAQLIETCERWLRATRAAGVRPPLFISPITGITGDHLRKVAARDGIDAPDAAIALAGVLISRRCYALVRDREYPAVLLYGGARGTLDFTGLVGGDMAATINWSTAEELLAADRAATATVGDPVDAIVERVLVDAFPDMRRALDPEGLTVEEFESFGPVRHFRDSFIAGWHTVLEAVAAERTALATR